MVTRPGRHPSVVLVVDDDPEIRDVLALLLADEGYRVVTAVDGVDALDVARRTPPDVILVDAGMPRLDGVGFCQSFRADGGTVPVILLTAADPRVVSATFEACGASAYIPKPFDIGDLLETVARLLPAGDALPANLQAGRL